MGTYHRTQILLEDWQYRSLKSLAEQEGVSMAEVLRRIVTGHLERRGSSRGRLQAMAGVGRDKEASGREHDRWLYGHGPAT